MLRFAQNIVFEWGARCFGMPHMRDKRARSIRLLEEAIEVCQCNDVPVDQVKLCADIVYGRPVGQPFKELGGVGVTWLAACSAYGFAPETVLEREVERILGLSAEHFAARNAEKMAAGLTGHANCAECGTSAAILKPGMKPNDKKLYCEACIGSGADIAF